jgi:hypothetical protein
MLRTSRAHGEVVALRLLHRNQEFSQDRTGYLRQRGFPLFVCRMVRCQPARPISSFIPCVDCRQIELYRDPFVAPKPTRSFDSIIAELNSVKTAEASEPSPLDTNSEKAEWAERIAAAKQRAESAELAESNQGSVYNQLVYREMEAAKRIQKASTQRTTFSVKSTG